MSSYLSSDGHVLVDFHQVKNELWLDPRFFPPFTTIVSSRLWHFCSRFTTTLNTTYSFIRYGIYHVVNMFFFSIRQVECLIFSPFVSCTSRVFVAHEIVSFDLKAQVIVDATNFRLSLFIFAKWKRKTANTLTKRITDYYRSDTMSMSLFFSCQWKYGLAIVLWTAEGVRVHKGRGTREIWEQRKSFSSLKPCNCRWTAKKILLMNGIQEKDHTPYGACSLEIP